MKLRLNWGVGVAVLYAVFASATVGFVVFAIAHPAALVSDDYYREGTQYDRRIASVANGRAAGARLVIAPAGATFSITPSHHGRAAGTVTWYRPSDAAFDRTVPLQIDARGSQFLETTGLQTGLWRVKVEWDVDDVPFYFEQPVMIAP